MLEIVFDSTEKSLLEKSNLFNQKNIFEFGLCLCYGQFAENFYESTRYFDDIIFNVKEILNKLDNAIKDKQNIRIWYSKLESEDVCNFTFLVSYLINKKKNIYACEISNNNFPSLSSYHIDEIKNLTILTKQLTKTEIEYYKQEWNKVFKDNNDIRYVENNHLYSNNFEYLDNLILEKLTKKEIPIPKLITECIKDRLLNYSSSYIFKERINYLININKILVTKEFEKKDCVGQPYLVKYIKKNPNPFPYSFDNKRYHTLNYYYQTKYNSKVFKVSLNTNLSCPNKINGKGCIFCSETGSGDFAGNINDNIITQFKKVKEIMHKKWPKAKYIGYFQANTNTYAPVSTLKEYFEPILKEKNVVGLNIATRSDAISEECLKYLIDLNQRTDLTIELGLQSMHETTLQYINRGHTLENFTNCVKKLKANNIKVVVHIINGLPNETKDMMIETVKYLNDLEIDGIKIHMLHILKNTELANIYEEEKFPILTKEEYIDIVVNQLEYLNKNIIINRITGDPKLDDLIEPKWLLKKFCVLNDIDKEMLKRNTYQGKRVN